METTSISNETKTNIRMLLNSTKIIAVTYLMIKLIKYLMNFIIRLVESLRIIIVIILLMIVFDEITKLNTIERVINLMQNIY